MREGGIWVFIEWANGAPREVCYELLGAARQLREDLARTGREATVWAVTFSSPSAAREQDLRRAGAQGLLEIPWKEAKSLDEILVSAALARLAETYHPEILLLGATAFGRSLAPRLAARLNAGLTADCTSLAIDPETGALLQTRPAFGGNLMATIVSRTRPQLATVRPKVFARKRFEEGEWERFLEAPEVPDSPIRILESVARASGINIADADILVSLGQGACSAECISLARDLAGALGGAVVSSRPLVDAGILPYAHQVGQTGKTVAPRIYLAIGISGAIQHMAGVAAETLIAVNTDPDAPIFQFAKWGLVGDGAQFLRDALEAVCKVRKAE